MLLDSIDNLLYILQKKCFECKKRRKTCESAPKNIKMVNLTSEDNHKSSENDKICKYVNEIIRIINVLLDT